ncbi:hypothetical protein N1851_015982 [Merluccius polli]|uniref:Immunoglobulin V-set domain-containing protein n=1 Tax=Merluccius polli TaxID=89951 RepID=A0AA47P275_MERPO|nr:hypothetical protein N1851_015982 [Merluccius polli]
MMSAVLLEAPPPWRRQPAATAPPAAHVARENPPKPEAVFTIESDAEKHYFMCVVDTTHLGPVTYQWKMDNGDWLSGTQRLDLSVDVNPQEVSCKVITRLSESKASSPTKNGCYKPAPLYEEDQTLTLRKCVTVQQPIKIIRWKHNGNLVVNWNSPDTVTYYGEFKGRTTLDAETLKLEIKDLTLSDGGTFSLETDKGPTPLRTLMDWLQHNDNNTLRHDNLADKR